MEETDERTSRETKVLASLAAPYRRRMVGLALVSLVGALLEASFLVLLTTALLALVTDSPSSLTIRGLTFPMGTVLATSAGAVALRLLMGLLAVRLSAGLTARVTADHRRRLSNAYLRTSWAVQQAEPTGRLQELLTSFVSRVTNAMTAMTQGITSALSLLAFLGAGLVVDPLSTTAVLAALAGLALVLTPLRRAVRRRSSASAKSSIAFAKAVAELGALGEEMQTFGVREQFAHRIDALTEQTTQDARRVQLMSGALTPVYTFLAYVSIIVGIGVLTQVGVRDVAAVGTVMLLMLRSLSYGQQLLTVSGNLAAAIPFLERLTASVQAFEAQVAVSGTLRPTRIAPLEFDQVNFSYSQDRVALTGLSLRVAPGEMLGVIGPSGAGKSTMAQLLLGLREPSSGAIRVAGLDLSEVDRSWWTGRVGYVPQEPRLFTGTVADNIRFFRSGISDDDLRQAAAQANVLLDIQALPRGFDTHLGERGGQLSGGQRQRISIARALVGIPEVLVLDEPTSSLDGQSETLIRKTIADLHGAITVVIIAHRMSTLEMCDRIVVIEGGRVTGIGAPDQLRTENAFYRAALIAAGLDGKSR